ncbi:Na+/H+ antiporter subunit E [Massilia sp. CFBP9012]|uniref:Na+/H+ antiporter subunit E n=1 Tax=Massilia sp. CFBP9012 TaxID=3096531 RepID=UPI002A69CDD9|nr:Na+/H+ antiporter subunit E [Massilia sp. CFBP9012]MDY0975892.1 Na+/H+ antiporter subunit E [Massilia sp. CFBP9012]
MMRWLPYPFVSLALCGLWLLLNQTLYPGHILLGALLGIAGPILTRHLNPLGYPRLRKPIVALRLLGFASVEVVRSCLNVSKVILFADYANLNSQFIRVPLDIRDPYGLAALSCLINMTPGTVWTELQPGGDPDKHELVLHVFDLHDAAWWVDTIKTRYEQPLIQIFDTEARHGDPA